jgi:hypothetical protein
MKHLCFAALAAFILFFTGCATVEKPMVPPITAADLSTDGLLVGTLFNFGDQDSVTLNIDNQTYEAYYRNGTFMLALPSGDHKLIRIGRAEAPGTPSHPYLSGFGTPLNQPFTVTNGKVTNIGGIYFTQVPQRRLRDALKALTTDGVVRLDNTESVKDFFRYDRADIYQALGDKKIASVQTKFLSGKELDNLRKIIAAQSAWPQNEYQARQKAQQSFLVKDKLGTAGRIYTDKEGIPESFHAFKLNTLEEVRMCADQQKRFACIVGAERHSESGRAYLIFGDDKQTQRVDLPEGARPFVVHLFGKEGIALANYDYRMYIKSSPQADWQIDQQDGIESALLDTTYKFADAADGFFTYYKGNDDLLTFLDAASGRVQVIEPPDGFGGGQNMLATSDGIVIGPDWSLLSNSKMYLRNNRGEWTTVELPQGRCGSLDGLEGSPDTLFLTCGGIPPNLYKSTDGGRSWKHL